MDEILKTILKGLKTWKLSRLSYVWVWYDQLLAYDMVKRREVRTTARKYENISFLQSWAQSPLKRWSIEVRWSVTQRINAYFSMEKNRP